MDIGLQKTGYISARDVAIVMQAVVEGQRVVMVLLDSVGKYSRLAMHSASATGFATKRLGSGESSATPSRLQTSPRQPSRSIFSAFRAAWSGRCRVSQAPRSAPQSPEGVLDPVVLHPLGGRRYRKPATNRADHRDTGRDATDPNSSSSLSRA